MMSKIMALDIGDKWVGVALSDALQMLARPYGTVNAAELVPYICNVMTRESIAGVVIGHPLTMQGTKSDQTRKVEQSYAMLSQVFSECEFWLFDERLSSKRATALEKELRSKRDSEKLKEHARAAAFILDGFLISQRNSVGK